MNPPNPADAALLYLTSKGAAHKLATPTPALKVDDSCGIHLLFQAIRKREIAWRPRGRTLFGRIFNV